MFAALKNQLIMTFNFKTLLVAFLVAAGSLQAQKNYFSASMGDGLGMDGEEYLYIQGPTNNTQAVSSKYVSYGSGASLKASFGHFITSQLSIEFGLNYQQSLRGQKLEYTSRKVNVENYWKGRSFGFTPSLCFSGNYGLGPFVKVGPTLQYITAKDEEHYYPLNKSTGFYSDHLYVEYASTLALGVYAEGGMAFRLGDKWRLTSSVAYQGVCFYPDEAEITSLVSRMRR